jgi:DNA-binding PadR family transcriptional regulator
MRIEDLSVNERILIHLRDFRGDPETSSTIEQTQEGIARAVGMRVNHVPRATKKLIEDGYIEDLLVHIGGLKRKRRAYFLTDSGAKIANDLLDKLRTQEVLFRDNTGKESTMKIDDIIFRTMKRQRPITRPLTRPPNRNISWTGRRSESTSRIVWKATSASSSSAA